MFTYEGQKRVLVSTVLGPLAYILANHWANQARNQIFFLAGEFSWN